MHDLIQRLRVEPTASQFLRIGDLVESLIAERKEAADRIAALEARLAECERECEALSAEIPICTGRTVNETRELLGNTRRIKDEAGTGERGYVEVQNAHNVISYIIGERDIARNRLRAVAQMLIASIGANGPENAEQAAERACLLIDELRQFKTECERKGGGQ